MSEPPGIRRLVDALRDRPRQLQRLVVMIVVVGMGLVLLQPLLRETRDTGPAEAREPAMVPPEHAVLPLPAPTLSPQQQRKVALGRRLFRESALSPRGMACASCHPLARYGTLPQPRSPSLVKDRRERNVPTVLNVALNSRFGWDGHLTSLQAQLDEVLTNPAHMGSNWSHVVAAVAGDPTYQEDFDALYGGRIDQETISDALLAFERALVTPGSPFDRYLSGESDALDERALAGFRRFREYGCIACHQGRNLGGNMTAVYGLFGDPFASGGADGEDLGLKRYTGREDDRHVFRVPSLRNVAMTAPYLHDGSAPDLAEAVRRMGRYQLGKRLPERDVVLLVAFLRSLTAPLPEVAR